MADHSFQLYHDAEARFHINSLEKPNPIAKLFLNHKVGYDEKGTPFFKPHHGLGSGHHFLLLDGVGDDELELEIIMETISAHLESDSAGIFATGIGAAKLGVMGVVWETVGNGSRAGAAWGPNIEF